MAHISPKARIGKDVRLAETAVIHDDVVLGDGSEVGEFCVLGLPCVTADGPLEIGAGSIIRSHAVLYAGSRFGPGFQTGHHVLVRDGVVAGRNLRIGSYCDLEGDTVIGDWVRMHCTVTICRGTVIGDLVWFYPNVILVHDPVPPSVILRGPRIEAGAVIATAALLMPAVVVGEGAFVGAMTRAKGEIPAGAVFAGTPGRVIGSLRRLRDAETGISAPWMQHFADAYPGEAQPRIAELHARIEAACDRLEASG